MKVNIDVLLEVYSRFDNWNDRTDEYNRITGEERKSSTLRSAFSRYNRKETVDEDVHVSERYNELSTSKLVTESELLEMHGYDPELWELISSNSTRSKIGTKHGEGYFVNTYSKITVKPKRFIIEKDNIQEFVETMNIKIDSVNVDVKKISSDRMLKISINDAHFRNGANEHYIKIRNEIIGVVKSKRYDVIKIIQGGDWFNADNSEGLTVKGTKVDHNINKMDMFTQAQNFICPIIEESLKNSNSVDYIYIQGNHDKNLAWSFAWGMNEKYPQVNFDLEESVFKYTTYKNVFIGLTHGDKPRGMNAIQEIYFNMYRRVMVNYDTIEIHTEHIHHEKVIDRLGIIHRTQPTANEIDEYSLENGYAGTNKVFILHEYNENKMKQSYVIDGE